MNWTEGWVPYPGAATPPSRASQKGAMADSEFWRGLAREFAALPDPKHFHAEWKSAVGHETQWTFALGAQRSVVAEFETIASRAGRALDPPPDVDLRDTWLDAVWKNSPDRKQGH